MWVGKNNSVLVGIADAIISVAVDHLELVDGGFVKDCAVGSGHVVSVLDVAVGQKLPS